ASANVTINVTQAPLTITAQDKSMVEGASVPALTAAYSGFVNGDTSASLATPVVLGTTATSASVPGSYPITATGATAANYAITHVNGTMTVTAASTGGGGGGGGDDGGCTTREGSSLLWLAALLIALAGARKKVRRPTN
ncbi:MAG: MBG-2 domain-containing protein, partial [Planctomycetaceae bacterium]|nr:MBG-2 domain-containing protein [Planctomycetaceae bacterium]